MEERRRDGGRDGGGVRGRGREGIGREVERGGREKKSVYNKHCSSHYLQGNMLVT